TPWNDTPLRKCEWREVPSRDRRGRRQGRFLRTKGKTHCPSYSTRFDERFQVKKRLGAHFSASKTRRSFASCRVKRSRHAEYAASSVACGTGRSSPSTGFTIRSVRGANAAARSGKS